MPEAGLEAAKEALRNFLDGDEQRPGVVPWDFKGDVKPPPGIELRYRDDDQTLWAHLLEHGVRVRFRWDGFRWVEEESDAAPAAEAEDTAQALAALAQAVRRLEDRLARLEHLLKGCLEGRG